MTSANVSDVPILMNLGQTQVQSAAKSDLLSGNFQELMIQTVSVSDMIPNTTDTTNPENITISNRTTPQCDAAKKVPSAKDENSLQMQNLTKEKAALDDFAEKTTDVLEEALDVTEEEIVTAMQAMGLGFVDLLDPNNLTKLIAELSPMDSVSLLVSDTVSNVLDQVKILGVDLLSQVDMDIPTLKLMEEVTGGMTLDVMLTMEQNLGNINEPQMEAMLNREANVISDIEITNVADQVTDSIKETTFQVVVDDTRTEEIPKDHTEETTLLVDETNDLAEDVEEGVQNLLNNSGESSKEETGDQTQMSGAKTVKTPVTERTTHTQEANVGPTFTQTVTQVTGEVETTTTYTTGVNTRDIINQIVTAARVNITNQVTSMEMELNPQNLGRMILNVAENDGKVSAHITLQNEAVRQALEGQMAILKDNLNQQGIKVEAVEVSVGTHEFERNLEEGQMHQDAREDNQQQTTTTQRRSNINLNSLDELQGVMTEEEALVASMMRDAGNSINFTA